MQSNLAKTGRVNLCTKSFVSTAFYIRQSSVDKAQSLIARIHAQMLFVDTYFPSLTSPEEEESRKLFTAHLVYFGSSYNPSGCFPHQPGGTPTHLFSAGWRTGCSRVLGGGPLSALRIRFSPCNQNKFSV